VPTQVVAFSAFISESGFGGEKQKSISVKDYDAIKIVGRVGAKKPTYIDSCGTSFPKE
jgi:hypothetical protein